MKILSQQFIQNAIANHLENQKCADLHAGQSCNARFLGQFIQTVQGMYKIYLLAHLIPFIFFKRKKFLNRPIPEVLRLIRGFIGSMLFAGLYIAFARRTICFITAHYKNTSSGQIIGAGLAGWTLCFESAGRQCQIALYCVNKSIETLYNMALRRKYPVRIPYGQCLLVGSGVGVICYKYFECPKAIRQNYLIVIDKILGDI